MSASGSGGVLLLAVAGGAIGDGRTGAVVAAVVALVGTAIGGLALARATGRIGWGDGAGSGLRSGAGVRPRGAGAAVGAGARAQSGTAVGAGAGAVSLRGWAVAALVVGLAGVSLGALHLATSSGGFGTGNGRAGAIVAMLIGAIGMALGRLALTRSRRRTVATG